MSGVADKLMVTVEGFHAMPFDTLFPQITLEDVKTPNVP